MGMQKGDLLPAAHQVVQRAHRLFGGGAVVVAVDLEDVDVARLETPEGGLDGGKDRIAGESYFRQFGLST